MAENKNGFEQGGELDPMVIMLTDEEGIETPFEFIDVIGYEGKNYVALLPVEESDGAEEVVLLQLTTNENGDEVFCPVEDGNVLMAVFEIFKERNSDEFNFVD